MMTVNPPALATLAALIWLAAAPVWAQSIEAYQVPESVRTQIAVALRNSGNDLTQLVKIAAEYPHIASFVAAQAARQRPQAVGRIAAAIIAAVPNQAPAIAAGLALATPASAGVVAQAAIAAAPGQASAIRAAIVRAVPTASTDEALAAGASAQAAGERPAPGATGQTTASPSLLADVPLRAPGRGNAATNAAMAAATRAEIGQAVQAALSRRAGGGAEAAPRVTQALSQVLGEQIRKNPAAMADSLAAGLETAVQMWRTLPPSQWGALEADVPPAMLARLSADLAATEPQQMLAQMPTITFALSRAIPEITPTLAPAMMRSVLATPQRLLPMAEEAAVESVRRMATVRPDLTATLAQLVVQSVRLQVASRPELAPMLASLPVRLVQRLLAPQRGQAVPDPAPLALSLALSLANALPEQAVDIAVAAVQAAPLQGRNEAALRTALGEAVVAGLAAAHPQAAVAVMRRLSPGVLGVFR